MHPDPLPLLVALLSHIARLEAELRRDRHPLAALLWATMRGPFLACDAMAEAERQAEAARAAGQAMPDLPRLLSKAGIDNARKLGLWLPKNGFDSPAQNGGRYLWVINIT